jgi:hypothetical protein
VSTPPQGQQVTEWYDEQGRVIASEQPNGKGRTEYWVYRYLDDLVDCFQISVFKQLYTCSRVARRGSFDNSVGYLVATGQLGQAHAHLWQPSSEPVSTLQVWDLRADNPDVVLATYDQCGSLAELRRNDRVVWQASGVSNSVSPLLHSAAPAILQLARAKLAQCTESVLALTVCFVKGDLESLPPCLGVVFEQDARAFFADPEKFDSDLNVLWNPTLQEDYDFPSRTQYPFVPVEDAPGVVFRMEPVEMQRELELLVGALNAQRSSSEPPFVLVDLANDATQYLSLLSESDRSRLARFGPILPSE